MRTLLIVPTYIEAENIVLIVADSIVLCLINSSRSSSSTGLFERRIVAARIRASVIRARLRIKDAGILASPSETA